LIDWFTVGAQIVNFLILVALLKHFLYDRIIQAMDQREQNIQTRLKEAEDKKKAAEEEENSFKEKKQELEQKREAMLARAKEEAEEQKKDLLRKGREEADGLRKRLKDSVDKEREGFLRDLKEMTARQVYSVSRKALKDLADARVEERVIDVFLQRIDGLKEEELKEMAGSGKDDREMRVLSGFEIPTNTKKKVTQTLHEKVDKKMEVVYEVDSDMMLGVELRIEGYKVAWSLGNYMDELEEAAREILDRESRGESETKEASA
jgi:F-type H+-transporting ATPase subunit b